MNRVFDVGDKMIGIIWALLFAIIAAILYEYLRENMLLYIILLVIVALALIVFEFYRHWKKKTDLLKSLYTFFGKSSSITPDVLLKTRPFNEYYYRRKEDASPEQEVLDLRGILPLMTSEGYPADPAGLRWSYRLALARRCRAE